MTSCKSLNPTDNVVRIWKGSSVGLLRPVVHKDDIHETSSPASQAFVRTVNHNVSSGPDNKTIQQLLRIENPDITEQKKKKNTCIIISLTVMTMLYHVDQ